jgi:folate-binding protein YgfZ
VILPYSSGEENFMIITEHNLFLKLGGTFANEKGFLKISGPDSTDFLHRLTSQDIKSLQSGMGAGSALLSPAATVVAFFDIYNCGQFFLLVIDKENLQQCYDALEKVHFAEDLVIADVSGEYKFLSVQGPKISSAVKAALGRISVRPNEVVGLEECLVVSKEDFNKATAGFHLFIKSEHVDLVIKNLEAQKLRPMSLELWNLLRIESGHFAFGIDIDQKNIILESGLSDHIARDKGCYPGQEVVERVFTYGNIAKKLMGLRFSTNKDLEVTGRVKLLRDNEDAGYVTSVKRIPWSDKVFGFGIVRKPFYEPGQKLKIENSDAIAEVTQLPNSFDIRKPSPKD